MMKPARFAHGHNPGGEATRFRPGDRENARRGVEARHAHGLISGPGNPNWKGGIRTAPGGYIFVRLTPEEAAKHPTAYLHARSWSIPRSHLVWNEHNPGDPVTPGYQIHHRNRITDDDRVENLEKMLRSEHLAMHGREKAARFRDPKTGRLGSARSH